MNNQNQAIVNGRFAWPRLLAAGVALVVAGIVLGYMIRRPAPTSQAEAPAEIPIWGELIMADIELEAPEEYVAYDLRNDKAPEWAFPGKSPDQVHTLMAECGLSVDQINKALAPTRANYQNANTIIHPDEALVLSLSPAVRSKLYSELGRLPGNDMMKFPYIYPGASGGHCLRHEKLGREITGMVKKLLYPRGDTQCLSDVEVLMQHIEKPADRLRLLKVLSRQPAVEASLRIRPGADVDKLIGYWGKGAKLKDVRPLLESMARMSEGSTISLIHLLPPFARQRLYTFPMPPKAGEPVMDCHWSSLNFFNEVPDNTLSDPNTAVRYIEANYYPIAEPSSYGDLISFVDENGRAIHSAVYLAGDLVFTKNGNNMTQPWKLARLTSLKAYYEWDGPKKTLVWRRKDS